MFNFIDIGVNLTDDMFQGVYNGKTVHDSDLHLVLQRAQRAAISHLVVTGTCHSDILEAIALIRRINAQNAADPNNEDNKDIYPKNLQLSLTVGIHPTRCTELVQQQDEQLMMHKLSQIIEQNRDLVVAVGEIGLDYDRTQFCDIPTQLSGFEQQFELARKFDLPLFLHHRSAGADFYSILEKHVGEFKCAVVHTYDDSWELAEKLLALKPRATAEKFGEIFFGINGCSMRTEANLETIAKLPLESILLETDSPWCDIRPSHASFKYLNNLNNTSATCNKVGNVGGNSGGGGSVGDCENSLKRVDRLVGSDKVVKKEKFVMGARVKSRNEPCHISLVLDVVSAVKQLPRETVAKQVYENTLRWLRNCRP